MLATDRPIKTPIPWANSAGGSYVREPPQASQIGVQLGAASYPDGFPPACFSPIAGGGSWPFGADFNGALRAITRWLRWLQAGGVIAYDSTFQTAIGGYPLGARVESAATPGLIWRSTVDNNTSNPDAGGANWSVIAFPDPNAAGLRVTGSGVQGANIRLEGNGATTPNKTIRAQNGRFSIVNNAYSAEILTLDDTGSLVTMAGHTASTGNITALIGQLRAGLGARDVPSDVNAGVIAKDFLSSLTSNGYTFLPNGLMLQWQSIGVLSNPVATPITFNFPTAFRSECFAVIGSYGALNPPAGGAVGFQAISLSQFDATNIAPGIAINGCWAVSLGK
jgi:hypothetical protein